MTNWEKKKSRAETVSKGSNEIMAPTDSEMIEKGMQDEDAKKALQELQDKPQTETITKVLKFLEKMGCDMSKIQYKGTENYNSI